MISTTGKRLRSAVMATIYLLCVSFSSLTPVWAQADVEAPFIKLQRVEESRAGESQVISATVTDNIALSSVVLFHRSSEQDAYSEIAMQAIGSTAIYTATVKAADSQGERLEYYIVAVDDAGNRTQEGFAFAPLERVLTSGSNTTLAETPAEGPALDNRRRLLYGAIGVLAVGALVAAAGSGGGGSGDPQADDPSDVPVNIIIDPL